MVSFSNTTELRAPSGSQLVGRSLGEQKGLAQRGIVLAGLVRDGSLRPALSGNVVIRAGDALAVQADPGALKAFMDDPRLELVGSMRLGEEKLGSEEIGLAEVVITQSSPLVGRTVKEVDSPPV